MKNNADLSLFKALLKKQSIEAKYPFKRGNFDILGFIIKLVLTAAIIALFAIFFGKFADLYLPLKRGGVVDPYARAFELTTLLYAAIILFMTISGISAINREIFVADDIKMFSAMPVSAGALYGSKLITIYFGQLLVSLAITLTLNISLAAHIQVGWQYYIATAAICFLLPLITIALASLLIIPFYWLKVLLKDKFIVNFLIVSALLGVMFYLYSLVLNAVKEMLLGGDLKYFFNANTMGVIAKMTSLLYPARWVSGIMLGVSQLESWLGLLGVTAACIALAMVIIRFVMVQVMQSRMQGSGRALTARKNVSKGKNVFLALVKKEFLQIFRTPSYMFSCFSVAVIMPLMVYFCMSIGTSLATRLVGLEFNLELAIFLTVLFGSLTNIFCATNISRDGYMFYVVKAFPVDGRTVFLTKIVLCLSVTALSQLCSAILITATGFITWYAGIFVFAVGTLFSLTNILIATRYDFNHAHFSTEDDGEIKESSNAVSVIIVLGLLMSFAVGIIVFAVKAVIQLKGLDIAYLTYLLGAAFALICAALATAYMLVGVKKKYYEFEGGGI